MTVPAEEAARRGRPLSPLAPHGWRRSLVLALALLTSGGFAERVRVATWNIENYLVTDRLVDGTYRRAYPKPEAEKAALRAVLLEVRPDVLAIQEIGDARFLHELRRDLRAEGLDYPHAVLLEGPDEARHLAVLSRLPFRHSVPHRHLPFRYLGTDSTVKRGLLEVVFETGGVEWRLFNLHLKSRFSDRADDPESLERRNGEAIAIRNRIAPLLAADPEAVVVVAGDFNDHPASRPLARFLAINDRPLLAMLDVADPRGDRWTHHYAREDSYERVDYILLSPGARARVRAEGGWIPDSPAMRRATDHRLLICELDFSPGPAGPRPGGATAP